MKDVDTQVLRESAEVLLATIRPEAGKTPDPRSALRQDQLEAIGEIKTLARIKCCT